MPLNPFRGESIAEAAQQAIESLAALSDNFEGSEKDRDRKGATSKCEDESARLKQWVGQHDVRSGALDHRLREASHLRERVHGLLKDLSKIATSGDAAIVFVSAPDSDDKSAKRDDESSIELTQRVFAPLPNRAKDDQSLESTLSIDTDFTLPDSLPDIPVTRIHDIVTLLNELSPSLLDPTPNERFERASHPDAAQFDVNHVKARFPEADEELVDRLGKANWRRRQSLRFLRESHTKSSLHGSGTVSPAQDVEPALSDSVLDTDASDRQTSISEHAVSSTSRSMSNTDGGASLPQTSVGGGLQSSPNDAPSTAPTTAPTAATNELFQGAGQTSENKQPVTASYKIPGPPNPNEDFNGQTFLCQFCSHWVSGIERPSDWTKHVFGDLEPYMCTYSNCILSVKTFGTRKAWWDHEAERHRAQHAWVCNPCKQDELDSVFDSSAAFDEHIETHHLVKLSSKKLQGIRDVCEKEIGRHSPEARCPLCQKIIAYKGKPRGRAYERAVRRHVSDHLEQLALFVAFPAGQMLTKEDDSEFQDDSDSEDGIPSEMKSVISKDTHLSKRELHTRNLQHFLADQHQISQSGSTTFVSQMSVSEHQPTAHTILPEAAQAQSTASESPSFPLLVQVPPPNQHFYSRQTLPTHVDKALNSPGFICTLTGKGGVGKTLAAIEYIHAFRKKYDAVFWLQADTTPGLADSYLQTAMALGIVSGTEDQHRVMSRARDWLQETDKRWLLVFDNALDWSDLSRYMPGSLRRSKGSVLITTQNEKLLRETNNVTHIRVNPLTRKAGEEMLLHYLDRDVEKDPEKHLANEISAFMSGLPVAIAQVAGYVSYSGYTLEELIETFRQWRRRTGVATNEADDLPAAFLETSVSYEGTLAMVWEVTLRELSQDARDVLNVMAYLNCAAVPRDMLWRTHDDPNLHFLDIREGIRMRKNIESLIKRRLVIESDRVFSMHRSLQRGLRENLSKDKSKQQTVFDQAVALVREVFPRGDGLQQPMPEKWSECQRLLPHLHALHDVYHAHKHSIKGSLDFAQLLLDAGMDQFERGITHEGLLLLNTAEVALDANSANASEEPLVMKADIHAMIGIMYDDLGIEKRQEALWRRERALELRKRAFEQGNSKTRKDEILVYNSEMEYAISLLHYHRYAEAEPIIERCLTKFKEWGSEDDIPFEYAKYYNKIALVRMYQGRLDEAIPLAAKGVQLMEKTGYTLFSGRFKFDMACIILQSGDSDRALRVHTEVYEQRLKVVGSTNQLSLHSMYAIGAIHELEGRLEEAEAWFRKVISQRRSFASWPDEALFRAQYHLSQVLFAQGKDKGEDDAEGLKNEALAFLRRLLPLDRAPELRDVTDEAILFDHMLPVSPGGPRFTGRGLLECFRAT